MKRYRHLTQNERSQMKKHDQAPAIVAQSA